MRSFHNRGLSNRRPKTHRGLVEDCQHANVAELIGKLSPEERGTREVYVPPGFGGQVILMRASKGVLRTWWWARCKGCGRRVEALHKPPWSDEWLCVRDHRLQYASRRHGRSEKSLSRAMHRRNPSYRTFQRIQRERARMVRAAAKARHTADGAGRRRGPSRDARRVTAAMPDLLTRLKDKPIIVEVAPGKPGTRLLNYEAVVDSICAEIDHEESMREAVAAAVEGNAEVLSRYAPNSRAPKARAARLLDRLARAYGV